MPGWAKLPVLVLILVMMMVLSFEIGFNSRATWWEAVILQGVIGFVAGWLTRLWNLI